ncbi:uncharacterized protein LOC111251507 [Varroa destructor]|uniref:Uncharacterized protein n=1 Tax=Varroa destructor TaxID=109461 RepID=A0A7M7KAB9_VARDE|nr:uncharacterized protein LOC111251507 [Varroa destructor]
MESAHCVVLVELLEGFPFLSKQQEATVKSLRLLVDSVKRGSPQTNNERLGSRFHVRRGWLRCPANTPIWQESKRGPVGAHFLSPVCKRVLDCWDAGREPSRGRRLSREETHDTTVIERLIASENG